MGAQSICPVLMSVAIVPWKAQKRTIESGPNDEKSPAICAGVSIPPHVLVPQAVASS